MKAPMPTSMFTFRPLSFALPAAFLATLAGCATPPAAQPPAQIGVASFNMAWAGSQQDFDRHAAVCQAVSWCDTRPRRQPGQASASEEAVRAARQCSAYT